MLDIIKNKRPVPPRPEANGHQSLTTFINPVSYLIARDQRHLYQQFDYLLADGWLFVAALRFAGIPAKRFSFDMTSMAFSVFNDAISNNKSIYFIGAKQAEIERFIKMIQQHFPKLNILGYRDGYFSDNAERDETLECIKILAPDIVVAGLGVPLQEKFLVDLYHKGWSGQGYTCGGFIHQTIDRLNYYPDWINKFNLRMPYRFIKEPHFRKRLPDYFKFLYAFTKDCFSYKVQPHQIKRKIKQPTIVK
ncbi:WecB/TagA/CpsF family glycosyltransferase [Pontibacter lucknowensis]|uniref:N-acetylglucosaminyldiphosphoundecaprenol N-acetyl-beta-D-mannosaminyltransferase n=1 Tax=Pontibacter lucknowensis TaxID=1077936 RepID=A0A1N7ATW5_9BACT|nr:WecB/TagA/CpsF family glycosyltransferase [Pontibacter lucknowensis]SIR42461.1 N-acetylglucosaminyldiphosphoundecaprenol N-acetyl-beta-D-mannosaminyltransferase [Pontibacter lucknowensis]